MKRGQRYVSSGFVSDIEGATSTDNFFAKSLVKQSMGSEAYIVYTCISVNSGFVRYGLCACKASALGRCSHVSALLHALLDVKRTSGKSCTSQPCTWNFYNFSKVYLYLKL